jgi:hypothetical protein
MNRTHLRQAVTVQTQTAQDAILPQIPMVSQRNHLVAVRMQTSKIETGSMWRSVSGLERKLRR